MSKAAPGTLKEWVDDQTLPYRLKVVTALVEAAVFYPEYLQPGAIDPRRRGFTTDHVAYQAGFGARTVLEVLRGDVDPNQAGKASDSYAEQGYVGLDQTHRRDCWWVPAAGAVDLMQEVSERLAALAELAIFLRSGTLTSSQIANQLAATDLDQYRLGGYKHQPDGATFLTHVKVSRRLDALFRVPTNLQWTDTTKKINLKIEGSPQIESVKTLAERLTTIGQILTEQAQHYGLLASQLEPMIEIYGLPTLEPTQGQRVVGDDTGGIRRGPVKALRPGQKGIDRTWLKGASVAGPIHQIQRDGSILPIRFRFHTPKDKYLTETVVYGEAEESKTEAVLTLKGPQLSGYWLAAALATGLPPSRAIPEFILDSQTSLAGSREVDLDAMRQEVQAALISSIAHSTNFEDIEPIQREQFGDLLGDLTDDELELLVAGSDLVLEGQTLAPSTSWAQIRDAFPDIRISLPPTRTVEELLEAAAVRVVSDPKDWENILVELSERAADTDHPEHDAAFAGLFTLSVSTSDPQSELGATALVNLIGEAAANGDELALARLTNGSLENLRQAEGDPVSSAAAIVARCPLSDEQLSYLNAAKQTALAKALGEIAETEPTHGIATLRLLQTMLDTATSSNARKEYVEAAADAIRSEEPAVRLRAVSIVSAFEAAPETAPDADAAKESKTEAPIERKPGF